MDLTAAWHSARKESNATSRNVVLIGAMDTKGDEYAFLRALIRRMKPEFGVLCVNTGIMECSDRSDLPIDVSPQYVEQHGCCLVHSVITNRVLPGKYLLCVTLISRRYAKRTIEAMQ